MVRGQEIDLNLVDHDSVASLVAQDDNLFALCVKARTIEMTRRSGLRCTQADWDAAIRDGLIRPA